MIESVSNGMYDICDIECNYMEHIPNIAILWNDDKPFGFHSPHYFQTNQHFCRKDILVVICGFIWYTLRYDAKCIILLEKQANNKKTNKKQTKKTNQKNNPEKQTKNKQKKPTQANKQQKKQ